MRLIDADAIPYTMFYKENWMTRQGIEKQGAWKDDIDAMPTIEERKKGEWVKRNDSGLYFCSECGLPSLHKWSFCEQCGADMREEKRNELRHIQNH